VSAAVPPLVLPTPGAAVVWIHATHDAAEASVKQLQRGGLDMTKLSIVGADYHTEEHVVGYYNTGDRMKVWGKFGAFWGGFWGMLTGSALFVVPGIGPLMVFGPLVGWIIGALEGAVVAGGFGAIGAALYGLGIPKDSVLQYETALRSNQYLVVVHGTAADVAAARRILGASADDARAAVAGTPVISA
jgi:hypothetical protein